MATTSDFFRKYVASTSLSTTAGTTLATLSFTPAGTGKMVFVVNGDVSNTAYNIANTDEHHPTEITVEIDGVEKGEIKGGIAAGAFSFLCFEDLSLASHSITLKGHRSPAAAGAQSVSEINIVAFGVDDWDNIEQGDLETTEIVSNDNRNSKILMQHVYYPSSPNVLLMYYYEYNLDAGAVWADVAVYIDDETNEDQVISKVSIGNRGSPPVVGATDWGHQSGVKQVSLGTGLHSAIFKVTKQDNTADDIRFRRLRFLAIPLDGSPFAGRPFHSQQANKASGPVNSDKFGFSAGVTTLLLGSHVRGEDDAFSTSLETATVALQPDGVTLSKSASMARNFAPAGDGTALVGGENRIFAHVRKADEAAASNFYIRFNPGNKSGPARQTSYLSVNALQMQGEETSATATISNDLNTNYDMRTLVEIYKPRDILRASVEEDVYLFAGLTSSQIVSKYSAGDIDRDAIGDLTVTGLQTLEALDRSNTQQAQQLIDLTTGLPDGVSSTPTSEYATYSHVHKLYKKSILGDLKISEKSTNTFSGTLSSTRTTLRFVDNDNEFDTEAKRKSILGSLMKVKHYDKATDELRALFSGRITDVDISDVVTISAINPDIDIMDIELPRISVNKLTSTDVAGITTFLSDSPSHPVPFFSGYARRLPCPNINKFYGTTAGVTPDFVDAFSDHAVGGFLNVSTFPSVLVKTNYSTTGVYRQGLEISDPLEFNNPQYIIEQNQYRANTNAVPTFRFQATAITTVTPTGLLNMPHGSQGGTDDLIVEYTTLGPVNSIHYVHGHNEGPDWFPGVTGNLVDWSPGGDEPATSVAAVTTQLTITRGTPGNLDQSGMTDRITANSGLEHMLNITSVAGVSYSMAVYPLQLNYTKDTDYTVQSSNSLRNFEDVISWHKPAENFVAQWDLNASLLSTSAGATHRLSETVGAQPNFDATGSALEFIGTYAEGSVGCTSSNKLNDFGEPFFGAARVIAFVQNNTSGTIDGAVIHKRLNTTSNGWELAIQAEDTIHGGGNPNRQIAQAKLYANSTTYTCNAAVTDGITLNDGSIHKIEFIKDESNNDFRLLVDSRQEGTVTNLGASNDITNTEDVVIGGTSPSYASSNFVGKIHKVQLDESAKPPPSAGTTYSATFTYKPDTYQIAWDYNVVTASDPIQPFSESIPSIAIDVLVAGSTISPVGLTGSFLPTSPAGEVPAWVRGPCQSGYAVRLNNDTAAGEWHLGESGLGITTTLGGSTNTSRIEFDNNDSVMKVLGDFSLYGCAIWRGGTSQDGVLIAKESDTSSQPSYLLGISAGKPFARVHAEGTNYDLTTASTRVDTKEPIHMMVSRTGTVLALYVNGEEVATTNAAIHIDSDYTSNKLVVGSDAVFGERWKGDVIFVGLTDFAHPDFAKYQYGVMSKGIKGAFSQTVDKIVESIDNPPTTTVSDDTNPYKAGKTLFHVPFIEGEGMSSKSRNLHRNFAQVIKRVLSDTELGLKEEVDGLAFDKAMVVLDDLELFCDFRLFEPIKAVDILEELLMVRGLRLRKSVRGLWEVIVDSAATTATTKFASGDGLYENIIKVNSIDYTSTDKMIKEIIVEYRRFIGTDGESKFHSSTSRPVSPYGADSKIFQFPSIYDDKTADKVADYISKKLRYGNKVVTFTAGMEARKLKIGDLVQLDIPRFGISDEVFQIDSVVYSSSHVQLRVVSYNLRTYDYDPSPLPGIGSEAKQGASEPVVAGGLRFDL